MSLEKRVVVDQIEVTESGVVQVRTATRIIEDGVLISTSLHRHSIEPGQGFSDQDERVQSICAAAHTDAVVATYKANKGD